MKREERIAAAGLDRQATQKFVFVIITTMTLLLISLTAVFANSNAISTMESKLATPETHMVKVEARIYKDINFNNTKTVNGVSLLNKEHIKVIGKEVNNKTQFNFCHNQEIEFNFKANSTKNFKWEVINSNNDLLGLNSTTGTGNFTFTTNNTSTVSQTINIAVTPIFESHDLAYEGTTEHFSIKVCPIITPTFTVQPNILDGNNYNTVTYTTQNGKDFYNWIIDGEQDIDYTLISGGTENDNTLEVIWLTTGEKEVKVGYSNNNEFVSNQMAVNSINVTQLGQILKVGDQYLGGTIYKVFGTPGRQSGYIISNEDMAQTIWSNNTDSELATFSTNGEKNTAMLIENNNEDATAAQACSHYSANQNNVIINDWYLPAYTQLKEAINALPEEFKGTYWSSTQCKMARRNAIAITDNAELVSTKKNSTSNQHKVRPVRSFTYEDQPSDINATLAYTNTTRQVIFEAQGGEAPYTFSYRINNGEEKEIVSEQASVELVIASNISESATITLEKISHSGDSFSYKIDDVYAYIPADLNTEKTNITIASIEE